MREARHADGRDAFGLEMQVPADVMSEDFENLFRSRFHDVWRYAALMLRNAKDAEDVAAETFTKAYEALLDGRGPRGDTLPWLLLIARRIVLNRARRARVVAWLPLLAAPEPHDSGQSFEDSDFRLWLDQMSRTLTAREREALFLRYLDDLDDAGAGRVLGISPSGVRTLRSRALSKLREHKEIWR